MTGRTAALLAAGICAAITIAVVVLPSVPYALRSQSLHVAVETTAAWISLAAAALSYGSYRRRQVARDLALTTAFVLFGTVNLLLSAIPSLLTSSAATAVATWGALIGRTLAATAFAYAAFAGEGAVRRQRLGQLSIAGAVFVVIGIGVVAGALAGSLPLAVEPDSLPRTTQPTLSDIHPTVPALQILNAVAFAVAAVGFVRGGDDLRDRGAGGMSRWLAAAAVTAAFARLHYALVPSLYSNVVYSGDFLRVGFYVLLLCAVSYELRQTWRHLAAGAAAEERRRIARDLHDGLAQELAFLASQSSLLAKRQPDEPRMALLASSSRRALDESRRAIHALAGGGDEPLPIAIARAAEEVADRHDTRLVLTLDDALEVPGGTKEQMVRIVREAVGNAARHGDPQAISVTLSGGAEVVLEVRDDGSGFNPATATQGGTRFGLTSMRERAEALGGQLVIESSPGRGACVTVRIPCPT